MKTHLMILAALLLLTAMTATVVAKPAAPEGDDAESAAVTKEADATQLPRVGLAELKALIDESAEADRVTVIDFWATWCVPCVKTLPALHEELSKIDGVRPVTVTLDGPDDEAAAIGFLKKHEAMRDAYMASPDADEQGRIVDGLGGKAWTTLVVPAVLVFDREGKPAGAWVGMVQVERVVARVKEIAGGE